MTPQEAQKHAEKLGYPYIYLSYHNEAFGFVMCSQKPEWSGSQWIHNLFSCHISKIMVPIEYNGSVKDSLFGPEEAE